MHFTHIALLCLCYSGAIIFSINKVRRGASDFFVKTVFKDFVIGTAFDLCCKNSTLQVNVEKEIRLHNKYESTGVVEKS